MKNVKKRAFLLLFVALSASCYAQVTLENTSSTVVNDNTATVSHTTSATANLMVVGVSRKGGNGLESSFTYNGISLTFLGGTSNGNTSSANIYYMLNPPSGTFDVVMSGYDNGTDIVVGVVTYSGVHTTTPFGTVASQTGTGTNSSLSVTSNVSDVIFDVFSLKGENATEGAGQSLLWDLTNGSGSTKPGAAGSTTMSWSSGIAEGWSHSGVAIKPDFIIDFAGTSVSNNTCDNDIDLNVNTTNPISTYSWTTSDGSGLNPSVEDQTGLSAGTYTITVTDDQGNMADTSLVFATPLQMNSSTNVTYLSTPVTTDGAIDLTVLGGSGNYSYLWSNSATTQDISNLSAGTYTVTVTDVTCSTTIFDTVEILYFVRKPLYLTDPSLGLDRIDPVATGDMSTDTTVAISGYQGGNETISDNFNTGGYSGGTSTSLLRGWVGNWVESDISGTNFTATGTALLTTESSDVLTGDTAHIYREVNLEGATAATLTFDITDNSLSGSDQIKLQVSNNGGVSYTDLITLDDVSGNQSHDLIAALGSVSSDTRIRLLWWARGNSSSNTMTFDNFSIAATFSAAGASNVIFTQSDTLCSDLIIKSGQSISIITYASVTENSMPVPPDVDVKLQYRAGPTTIIDITTSPTWDGSKLTWTSTLGSDVTIPAGEAISLIITPNDTKVAFTIDYDSETSPSRIILPVTTAITIDNLAMYDAAYPGGSVITEAGSDEMVYLRSTVSDPFGYMDITAQNHLITDPSSMDSLVTASVVDSTSCSRTYEYCWTTPSGSDGNYSILSEAFEGTEGVTYTALLIFEVASQCGPGGVTGNLELWLKADAELYSDSAGTTGAADGMEVANWGDQSDNEFDFTNPNSTPSLPVLAESKEETNFNPTLQFTNPDFLNNPTMNTLVQDVTIFLTFDRITGGSRGVIFGSNESFGGNTTVSGPFIRFIPNTNVNFLPNQSPTPWNGTSFTLEDQTNPVLITARSEGTTLDEIQLFENGKAGTIATLSNGPGNVNQAPGYDVGGKGNGGANISNLADINVHEVIAFSSDLSVIDRNKINSYLALKYGITLDQSISAQDYLASDGITEMWDSEALDAEAYDNDIVGIGRDDCSALGQVKSKSVNADAIVTLEAEGEGTNASPVFVDMDDLEFLTWGNNDGDSSWTLTGAPDCYVILQREWLVQETGDVGTVSLSFDVADPDFDVAGLVSGSTYYFIYDSNTDGDLSDETPLSMADQGGDVWQITGIDLSDGQLFTLASGDNSEIVALNDAASTTVNLLVTIDVQANDTDIDGGPGEVSIVSAPPFGSVIANADGTVTYEPATDYIGLDTFVYAVCDNSCPDPCDTATVVIDVEFALYTCTSSTSDTLTTAVISGAISYTWTLPAGAVITSSPVDSNIIVVDWSAVTPGQYSICVLATNDCGDGTQTCQEIVVNMVTLSTMPSDILCKGDNTGAIDLTVSGDIPAYDYNWDNGSTIEDLSNLAAGTYNVTVTDKYGCVASIGETLTEPATALSLSGTTTDENPFGNANGAIDITVLGGITPYTYSWSNGSINEDLTGLSGGTYIVTVTDLNDCTITQSFTVNTVGGPLTVASIVGTDVLCNGGNDGTIDLEIIGGTSPYTYDWDNDGTGDNDDAQDLSGLSAGTYNVTVTDNVSAMVTSSITISEPATAVSASTIGTNVTCNGNTDGAVDLTASGGTGPLTYSWSTGDVTEDLFNVVAGTYDVTVTDANGCTATASQVTTEPVALTGSGLTTDTPCDPGNTGAIDLVVAGGSSPFTFAWSTGATSEDITGLTAGNYAVTITDNNSCTDIQSFTINSVCIGMAKNVSSGPVNNNDGTYTLTYDIKVKNEGDVTLHDIQIVEDLNTTYASAIGFATGLVFSSDFTTNGSFDGNGVTDLLASSQSFAVGDSGLVQITLTVTPGLILGIYNNSITTSAQSAESISTSDISHDGTETDPEGDGPADNSDPTPVTFTENPEIGVAKILNGAPVNNSDGTYTLSYLVRVENTGDVPLYNIQLTDTLSNTFPGLTISNVNATVDMQPASTSLNGSGSYDGLSGGDANLLSGMDTLLVGEFGIIRVDLTVRVNGSLGVFNNSAHGNGVSPGGTNVTDISHDGTDVDPEEDGTSDNSDPTPISFTENPIINVVKTLNGTPVNNADGTYTLSYDIEVGNQGDVPLYNVQLTDTLSNTFPGLTISSVLTSIKIQPANTTLTSNGGYDGFGDVQLLSVADTLLVSEVAVLNIILTVELNNSLGPFTNTAITTGNGPGGTPTTDDDSVPLTFTENPSIGIAKTVDTPVNNNGGTYSFNYTIKVENTGDVPLSALQVTDNLSTTFAGASFVVDNVTSADFSLNYPGYDGSSDTTLLVGTDTLAVDSSGMIVISLTVTPFTNLGPYNNTARTKGTSPGGTMVTDDSNDGTEVDPDDDGDPTNNNVPTPVSFLEDPQIGLAKDIVGSVINNMNGTYTLTYEIRIENLGDVPLYNLQLIEDLATTYALATGFSVNSYSITQQPGSTILTTNGAYNGSSDVNLLTANDSLLVGEFALLQVNITVTPGSFGGVYNNSAIGVGTSSAGRTIVDYSEDGMDVDPDNNGIATDNNIPTPVTFFENPIIGLAKSVVSVVDNGDGSNDIIFRLIVENFGDVFLDSLVVHDDIINQFITVLPSAFKAIDGSLVANSLWDGSANSNILDPGQTLGVGDVDSVFVGFTVIPGIIATLDNLAIAMASSPMNVKIADTSTDGLDADGTDDDGLPDESIPTPVYFNLKFCPTAVTNPHILFFKRN